MKGIKKYLKRTYQNDLNKLYKFLVPTDATTLRLNSDRIKTTKKYDYIILDNCIGDILDIQNFFSKVKKIVRPNGRVIVSYYNYVWEPILKTASLVGLRKKVKEQNWLDNEDIGNLLSITGYDVITRQKRFFGLTTYVIARPKQLSKQRHTVSIIIPARNEAGNISTIIKRVPKFGSKQEIIFVEGHSVDDTWLKIQKLSTKNKKIKSFKQKGIGKYDAVKLGFKNSTGDILIIYDADMTVNPLDLVKFYDALCEGYGDFANGTRLVYPMEKDAMQTLNKFFNKFFSIIFTWILGQRFKDTLCGTKALFRQDYFKINKTSKLFGKDPFGDFYLIFGAIKINLKVVEIPVRYGERKYGSTNISRFKHGLQLIKMIITAYYRFKLW